jgi:hypothetical protein
MDSKRSSTVGTAHFSYLEEARTLSMTRRHLPAGTPDFRTGAKASPIVAMVAALRKSPASLTALAAGASSPRMKISLPKTSNTD